MPYRVVSNASRNLVVEVKHDPANDDPDTFIASVQSDLVNARSLKLLIWELDGDNAFLGLVQRLRSQGTEVEMEGQTARAREVIRLVNDGK